MAFFVIPAFASAATYYVANSGSDSNNGTSSSTPWQTLSHADSVATNGDTVLLSDGSRFQEVLQPGASGITYGAYGTGAQPVVAASDKLTWTQGAGQSAQESCTTNCRFDSGFETANFTDWTAQVHSGSTTITIDSSLFAHGSSSMAILGDGTHVADVDKNISTVAGNNDVRFYIYTPLGSIANSASADVSWWGSAASALLQLKTNPSGNVTWITIAAPVVGNICNTVGVNYVMGAWNLVEWNYIVNASSGGAQLWVNGTKACDVENLNTTSTPISNLYAGEFGSLKNGTTMHIDDVRVSTGTAPIGPFSAGVPGTVWYASQSTNPLYPSNGSIPLTQVTSYINASTSYLDALTFPSTTTNGYYWDGSSTLYVYSPSGNPSSTVEVPTQDHPLDVGFQNISLSGIDFRGGRAMGIYGYNNISGLTLNNDTFELNYKTGTDLDIYSGVMSNVTIESSTFQYNGASGLATDVESGMSNWQILNNTAVHNDQVASSSGGWGFSSGIHFYCASTNGPSLISGNISAYNGPLVPTDYSTQGNGIWADTCNNVNITKNLVHDNISTGIFLEENVSSSVSYNISYNNMPAGCVNESTSSQCNGGNYEILADSSLATGGNTIYNNVSYGGQQGIVCANTEAPTSQNNNNIFRNNIAIGSTVQNFYVGAGCNNDGTDGSGNIYDHNAFGPDSVSTLAYWTGVGTVSTYSGLDTAYGSAMNNIHGDPLFVSSSTYDFILQSNSPAIDAGVNLGSTYENGLAANSTWPANMLTLNQNNFGSGWDVGAYVYTETSTPSVAMTAPTNGATVSSTIMISASSTDTSPASISSIQFYLDGTTLGSPVTSTSSLNTYSYSWNTTSASNASHTLYALSTDNYENTASSSVITVTVSNLASLSVTTSTSLNFSAAHGSTATSSQSVVISNTASTSTTLNWSASSTQAWLTFSKASSSIAGGASTTISFIANPSGLALGTYNATATVSDPSASNSPQNIPVSFVISATGISISLTSPTNGITVTNAVALNAIATSTAGISSVQFYLDGSVLGSLITSTSSPNTYSYTWDTTQASDGSHSITALATDGVGNATTSAAISVTVSHGIPNYDEGGTPAPVLPSSPSTPTTTAVPASSLQAQLNILLAELASLQTQAAGRGITTSVASSFMFIRNLALYYTGTDVTQLQQFLIDQNAGPAALKLKVHGITKTFGTLTFNALIEFQKSVGIMPASGYFGPITRAWISIH